MGRPPGGPSPCSHRRFEPFALGVRNRRGCRHGPPSGDCGRLLPRSWRIYKLLTTGVPIERRDNKGRSRHDVRLAGGLQHPENNESSPSISTQSRETKVTRRPDMVLFCNGLPLGLSSSRFPARGEGDASRCLRSAAARTQPRFQRSSHTTLCLSSRFARGADGTVSRRFDHYAPSKTVDRRRVWLPLVAPRWRSSCEVSSSLRSVPGPRAELHPVSLTSAAVLIKRLARPPVPRRRQGGGHDTLGDGEGRWSGRRRLAHPEGAGGR